VALNCPQTGEDVIAFTFAKHGGVMIVNQHVLKRLHVFLWW
jgi:hypothetical protein